jgi:hypothetical protein
MTAKERIDVIQQHIAVLRTENSTRGQTLGAIWRFVLVGFAAVVTLGDKVNLDLLGFAFPTLLMCLVAYWLGETAFLVRTARCIAKEELKVNEIAGMPLLTYETEMWEWRRRKLGNNVVVHLLLPFPVIAGFFAVVGRIQAGSRLMLNDGVWALFWLATLISFTGALFNYYRYQLELHPEWYELRPLDSLRTRAKRACGNIVPRFQSRPGPWRLSPPIHLDQPSARRMAAAAVCVCAGTILLFVAGPGLAADLIRLPEFLRRHPSVAGGIGGVLFLVWGSRVLASAAAAAYRLRKAKTA